jgi:hypothetical protein
VRPPLTSAASAGLVEVRERMQASLALSHLTVHSLDPTGLASIGPHTRGSGTVELSSFNA